MDFLAQIAEYCSAYSTPQVLAALPSHSVFVLFPYCSAFITLPVLAAIRNPLSCLSLALSVFSCFDSCPCFLDLPFVFPFGLCLPLLGLLLMFSDYPSCLNPLDIVRRSTTHACPRNTLVSYPQHIC